MKAQAKQHRIRWSRKAIGHLIVTTLMTAASMPQSFVWAEDGEFLIEAQSIRETLRKARVHDKLSEMTINDRKVPILYVYEGEEQDYVFVGKTPSMERGERALNNRVEVDIHRVVHSKNIKISSDFTDAREALTSELVRLDIADDFKSSEAIHSIRDNAIVKNENWPLNWNLGQDARMSLTYDAAVDLLKTAYHWDDGSEYMPDPKSAALCDCGDTIVWDDNSEKRTVRDLLLAVLSQAHRTQTDRFGQNVLSYQVIPVGITQDGTITWNVLVF